MMIRCQTYQARHVATQGNSDIRSLVPLCSCDELNREALKAFGSNEEIFAQCPDVAGLLLKLRIEGTTRADHGAPNVVNTSFPRV